MKAYSKTTDELSKQLKVDITTGLSNSEAKKRLVKYGENKLLEAKKKSAVFRFVSQFNDFMIIVLLIAAGVSFIIGIAEGENAVIEPVIILSIVVLNAIFGFVQEWRAEKSIEKLKKLSSPHAKVLRSKKVISIDAKEVVPGDVLVIASGDIVCADARIIEADALETDESGLTGESESVIKDISVLPDDTPLAERKNMVMSSCPVIGGRGRALVVATGMDTEVGRIAGLITEAESPLTPLQKRLSDIGKILGILALLICCVVFVIGVWRGIDRLEMFVGAVSLAVAAIPEGLPAIITIMLAVGVRKMAKKKAVMKNLPSVETLGSASVICADKTGTLTLNKMTVTDVVAEDKLNCLAQATLCCDMYSKNPTDVAISDAAVMMGEDIDRLFSEHPAVEILPFSSSRKRMSTLHHFSGKWRMITKGAVDYILPLCTHCIKDGSVVSIDNKTKSEIRKKAEELGDMALRVICVAKRDFSDKPDRLSEEKLTYLGLIAMQDPPRPEVKESVEMLSHSGVRTVMITGDHAATAYAIAKNIGICSDKKRVCSGTELTSFSDDELSQKVIDYDVFARVTPEHKMRIVKALQARGEVVAMTGDGVNDAPALSGADIGCAPGGTGTEVAKAAADMIMTDDNFKTIADAVYEGRAIFSNIKKAVRFLLSSNLGEIITVFGCLIMGLGAPLSATALLWVNLITDSLPATALSVDPCDGDIPKNTDIFDKNMISCIITEGLLIGALTLFAYSLGNTLFGDGRAMCFSVLSISQLVHSFNMRSEKSIFGAGIFKNKLLVLSFIIGVGLQAMVCALPGAARVFGIEVMNGVQWCIVAGLSLVPLVVCEVQKVFNRVVEKYLT